MQDDELLVSTVPRALELRSKLYGFELPDLLVIFMNLAITNLIFGASHFRYPAVWGTTVSLALFLFFFSKRGKPDSYLQHVAEFYLKPSYRAAGIGDPAFRNFKRGVPNEGR